MSPSPEIPERTPATGASSAFKARGNWLNRLSNSPSEPNAPERPSRPTPAEVAAASAGLHARAAELRADAAKTPVPAAVYMPELTSAVKVPRELPAIPPPLVIGSAPAAPEPAMDLPDDVHKVPDTVLDGADLGGVVIRGASLRGDGSRQRGDTRRDAMDICRLREGETDVILGCVASGVASEPLSHVAAAQACTLVREEVRPRLSALFSATLAPELSAGGQDLMESVADRLVRLAGFLKADPRALSTTLTVSLVDTRNGPDGMRYVGFIVGGNTAFVLREHAFLSTSMPASKLTAASALPTRVGQVAMFSGKLLPQDALLICTGGLGKHLANAEVSDQLSAWWGDSRVPTMLEFGWQLSFRAAGQDSDRTAICLWNRAPVTSRARRRRSVSANNADSG